MLGKNNVNGALFHLLVHHADAHKKGDQRTADGYGAKAEVLDNFHGISDGQLA